MLLVCLLLNPQSRRDLVTMGILGRAERGQIKSAGGCRRHSVELQIIARCYPREPPCDPLVQWATEVIIAIEFCCESQHRITVDAAERHIDTGNDLC